MKIKEEKTGSLKGKEWLKREMRPYRGYILLLTVLTASAILFSISFSYIIQYIVNSAQRGEKSRLILFSSVALSLVIGRVILLTVNTFLQEKFRAKITVGLRSRTFYKILRTKYPSVERYHSGDLLNRLTTDVQEVANDTISIMPAFVGMAVQCVGAISALLMIDPLFTVVFTLGGLLIGLVSALFRKKVKKYHKDQVDADGKSRSYMQEGITSLLTVKAYSAEEKSCEKASEYLDAYYKKRMQKNRFHAGMHFAFSLLSNAGTVFAIIWCSARILLGKGGDYGSILSVMMLLGQLQHPFASFSSIMPTIYARSASGERLAEIDEGEEEETIRVDGQKLCEKTRSIRFDNLSFTYGRTPVLQGVNASIEKGKIVCITGESGSGKSTLFKLLLSVYEPQEGGIYLVTDEGQSKITAKERNLFAYVPQGNFLFSGTIYENMSVFAERDKKVEKEEIRKALSIASADFVFDLPKGIHTSLKERGGGLSEGQLQRLAIARAILSNRPILLLDEATSALDSETEKEVLENIRKEEGKTCFIVTHRPAALAIADEVIEVKGGKIKKSV